MLEKVFRDPLQKFCVDPLVLKWKNLPISPSLLTFLGCMMGIACGVTIAWGEMGAAILLLLTSGYLDMLDGTWARLTGKTSPFGCALDIVSDRIVEAAIVLGLYLAHPEVTPLISLFMLGSILICVTTFLVVGIFSENSTNKSFHYSVGLKSRGFYFFCIYVDFSRTILFFRDSLLCSGIYNSLDPHGSIFHFKSKHCLRSQFHDRRQALDWATVCVFDGEAQAHVPLP